MGFRDDHGDELLDASISKHYSLLKDIGVYGKRDAVHCDGSGKSSHGNQRWDKVGFFN